MSELIRTDWLDPRLARAMHRSPFALAAVLWPRVRFYREQRQIIEALEDGTDEVYVVAGNELGKDFVAGFVALATFLRKGECRVVSTSVKDDHLRVLWGEIGRFIDTAALPLLYKDGGPLLALHRELRRAKADGTPYTIPYCRGMVSEKGEGLAGHHAAHTLAVIDEASGVDEVAYANMQGWADQFLIFGNPNPVPKTHWFRRGVEAGDLRKEAS